jgi:hypothetical protein
LLSFYFKNNHATLTFSKATNSHFRARLSLSMGSTLAPKMIKKNTLITQPLLPEGEEESESTKDT